MIYDRILEDLRRDVLATAEQLGTGEIDTVAVALEARRLSQEHDAARHAASDWGAGIRKLCLERIVAALGRPVLRDEIPDSVLSLIAITLLNRPMTDAEIRETLNVSKQAEKTVDVIASRVTLRERATNTIYHFTRTTGEAA